MAEKKYVRPTVAGWLVPLMLGPWISTYGAVSLYAAFGPNHEYVPRWVKWIIGMGFGTLFASVYVLALVLVDVLLLSVRRRTLPTGKSAWLMSMGSPLIAIVAYSTLSPLSLYKYGPWAIVAALLVPIVGSAFGVRLYAGEKTPVS